MKDIPIGTTAERRLLVTPDITIEFLDNEQARVLATPWMIAHMEMTAREAVKPLLDEGEDCVGTEVNVRHLAATPMGMSIRFEARVTSIEGKRIRFAVEAWDEKEKIGEGTHERHVIYVPKFASRLALKRAGQ